MRDDLKLAAYAVSLGFTLEIQGCSGPRGFSPDLFDSTGIPHDGLAFHRGPVAVWQTAQGWRVAKLEDERFPKPQPSDFHANLKAALDVGAAIPIFPVYTAFCQDVDGSGTIWIDHVEAEDLEAAKAVAREACATDWDAKSVHVLGLAAGKVEIAHWEDLE